MPIVHNTLVALRFSGDDLNPDELTAWLGVAPSRGHRKGDESRTSTGATVIRKSGLWLLRAADRAPGDLDAQIIEILKALPSDPAIWSRVAAYNPDLSIGLFLEQSNESISISPPVVRSLAERGIELEFDIYGPITDDPGNAQADQ